MDGAHFICGTSARQMGGANRAFIQWLRASFSRL
jgi:hypothetical protein